MLSILKEEGFRVSDRQLHRLRSRNGWLMRGLSGFELAGPEQRANVRKRRTTQGNALQVQPTQSETDAPVDPALDPAINYTDSSHQQHQLERRQHFQERSDELRATNKRRRRTRGYGGLRADPPGPPRFPSETTLDESKVC